MVTKMKCNLGKWSRSTALLAIGVGLAISGFETQAQEKQVGEIANDFEVTNVKTGEKFRLSDLKGSIVVLDFFSYW